MREDSSVASVTAPTMAAAVRHMTAQAHQPFLLVPTRFVTIKLAAAMTGLTVGAIEMKIARGVWLEGRQWVKRDGRVMIDIRGYERWAETGTA